MWYFGNRFVLGTIICSSVKMKKSHNIPLMVVPPFWNRKAEGGPQHVKLPGLIHPSIVMLSIHSIIGKLALLLRLTPLSVINVFYTHTIRKFLHYILHFHNQKRRKKYYGQDFFLQELHQGIRQQAVFWNYTPVSSLNAYTVLIKLTFYYTHPQFCIPLPPGQILSVGFIVKRDSGRHIYLTKVHNESSCINYNKAIQSDVEATWFSLKKMIWYDMNPTLWCFIGGLLLWPVYKLSVNPGKKTPQIAGGLPDLMTW